MIEAALFGAGRIGEIHAGNLARRPQARLKHVVDVKREAAAELTSGAGSWKTRRRRLRERRVVPL